MTTEYRFSLNEPVTLELKEKILGSLAGTQIRREGGQYVFRNSKETDDSAAESFYLSFPQESSFTLTIYSSVELLEEVLLAQILNCLKDTGLVFSVDTP